MKPHVMYNEPKGARGDFKDSRSSPTLDDQKASTAVEAQQSDEEGRSDENSPKGVEAPKVAFLKWSSAALAAIEPRQATGCDIAFPKTGRPPKSQLENGMRGLSCELLGWPRLKPNMSWMYGRCAWANLSLLTIWLVHAWPEES